MAVLIENPHKLKASTLVEVIVAMTIVMLTMGLTIRLITKIFQATQNHKKLQSYLLLTDKHIEAVKAKVAVRSPAQPSISVSIEKIKNPSLSQVTTTLADSGSVDVLMLKQLILAEK